MKEIALEFERLVDRIFKTNSFASELVSGDLNGARRYDNGIDIEIKKGSQKFGVEVKLYRSRRVSISSVKNSLIQINNVLISQGYQGGFLFTTVNVEPSIREDLQDEFKIQIIDRGILFFLTKNDDKLRSDLESILLKIAQTGEDDIYEGIYEADKDYSLKFVKIEISKLTRTNEGNELCKIINSISPGKEKSKEFEEQCEEIVKHLFSSDLTLWESQNSTSDRLHYFDLIAKISSSNDFWKSLARDFNSRFVIFEFKNYIDEIKQGQVYTTEKYLYKTALRSIAFIISRKGADKNAATAMEGSLRENGKLIISLDLTETCKMLVMKDNGDDPNTYLSEKIDTILMKLSR